MMTHRIRVILFLLLSLQFSVSYAQDASGGTAVEIPPGYEAGRALFRSKCASCHLINEKMTGPALYNARQQWIDNADFDGISGEEWFYRWIKNSSNVIKTGHPYANKLFNEYQKSVMTSFATLTNEQIDNIFVYVQGTGDAGYDLVDGPPVTPGPTGPSGDGQAGGVSDVFMYILVTILAIVVIVLIRVTVVLGRLIKEKEGVPIPAPIPIYKNKQVIGALLLVAVVLLGNMTVNNAINLGRQEGYQPDQPIKFSHEIHAGINKVDCQYCHSTASKGKHSNIPSVNVCMNCHKQVKEAKKYGKYGRKEIAKIYAAIGFNPNSGFYYDESDQYDSYADVPRDTVVADLTAWLEGEEGFDMKKDTMALVAVVNQIQKPVDWVRIHNLPDHVYFNHQQHVVVGKQECQTCHGPVEEMEELYQYSPLSMGWCINCHRGTEIDFTGNAYYETYKGLHEKYQKAQEKGKVMKVTVETIGGTECQKCHY